ncbi:MAG: Lsr2 family protein [Cryobacterium sp.]|nr:Lsr2 family protein [Cryobacterium sp.]MCC7127422.1 Lsr2 family protein [Microbacteriaceae bacterium]MCO5293978.1 Lsr2 family protein [Homoserinimonas sp.]MBX3090587.1 Lsr2 family protein [Cryobacterium sp.]MBX3116274.1 Lsr2 family protein [Cryobacterium sp.]
MGKKVTVQLVDDLDGSLIPDGLGHTVRFGFEGRNYEIDLKSEHSREFAEILRPYIAAGREAARNGRKGAAKSSEDVQAIREWARRNGHPISDRGRIAVELRQAYYQANPTP